MFFDAHELLAFGADLGHAAAQAPVKIAAVVAVAGHATYNDIRAGAPVRTGRLRDSVYLNISGLDAEVGATAPYADIVEGGDSRQAPEPFVAPGVNKNLPGLYAGVEKVAGSLL